MTEALNGNTGAMEKIFKSTRIKNMVNVSTWKRCADLLQMSSTIEKDRSPTIGVIVETNTGAANVNDVKKKNEDSYFETTNLL